MSKPIFREYIGVKETLSDFPTQIINPNIDEFHFILGFASEDKHTGNGVFKETWDVGSFGPEKVKQMKENFTNVKVIISIGGYDAATQFHSTVEKGEWIKAAVESLGGIILKYKDENGGNLIDGIDISFYEIYGSADMFSSYIGDVITALKNYPNIIIKLVSIAPSQNNSVNYEKLLSKQKDNIDFVNYQFYNNYVKIPTTDEFVDLFKTAVADFHPAKVLAGFSIDPERRNKLPWAIFIDGCKTLKNSPVFHGAFIWNANDSANYKPPFTAELQTQSLLTE